MRIIGILTVVVLLLVAVAIGAGWIRISSESEAGSRKVEVKLDGEELSSDVEGAKEGIQRTLNDLTDDDDDEDVDVVRHEGVLTAVGATSLTLEDGDGVERTFVLDEDTVVEIGGEAGTSEALRVGDRAIVARLAGDASRSRVLEVTVRR